MSDDGYELTIHGLLRKRKALLQEVSELRERIAIATNDVEAIDRILRSLGHTEELSQAPAKRYSRPYGRNEIRQVVLDHMRQVARPMTTRELAVHFAEKEGKDINDRVLMYEVAKRVSKVMQVMTEKGIVRRIRSQAGKVENRYELA